jgi:hypothetical protein
VIKQLVESINIYGFSVQKFKRTLKLLLTQHFYENPLVYVHQLYPDGPPKQEKKEEVPQKEFLLSFQNVT